MQCDEARDRWLDVSEHGDKCSDALLEEHLSACAGCRACVEEQRRGQAAVASLPWVPTSHGLERRILDSGPRPAGPRALVFGVGALVSLGAAATMLILGVLWPRERGIPSPEDVEARAVQSSLERIASAERGYLDAIGELQAHVRQRAARWPEPVRAIFEEDLAVIDASIGNCERVVASYQGDLRAQRYLLAAYQHKVLLLQEVLTWRF